MVLLEAVRSSNRQLRSAIPDITALFVGGTSGIGQSTLRQLVLNAESPNIYLVGRSETSAAPFVAELRKSNPRGKIHFLEADVSLMGNVDRVCKEVQQHEKQLNLLFMTTGGLSLSGRKETKEGIDHLFALRYYARMRFVQNLLPLLEEAKPGRVVSVLGGGFEGSMKTEDLDLRKNYSLINCAFHAVTMTSLAMDHLAATTSNRNLSFVHSFPGIVNGTNLYNNSFPKPVAVLYNAMMGVTMYPFSVGLTETGERHLFHATSARFPGKGPAEAGDGSNQGIALPSGVQVATGADGKPGSGVYLANWKGETSKAGSTLQKYRADGMPATVWQHTTELLGRATQGSAS